MMLGQRSDESALGYFPSSHLVSHQRFWRVQKATLIQHCATYDQFHEPLTHFCSWLSTSQDCACTSSMGCAFPCKHQFVVNTLLVMIVMSCSDVIYMIVMSCSIVDSFETIINDVRVCEQFAIFQVSHLHHTLAKSPQIVQRNMQDIRWNIGISVPFLPKYMLSIDPIISNMANYFPKHYIMCFLLIAENNILINKC